FPQIPSLRTEIPKPASFAVFLHRLLPRPSSLSAYPPPPPSLYVAGHALISHHAVTHMVVIMGGHGGLNILPQKKWNVYNFDNREKVRLDEEKAAKEEQIKQEQIRKREAESRLERLRSRAHGSDPSVQVATTKETVIAAQAELAAPIELEGQSKSDSNHINLFEGIKIFDPIEVGRVRKREGREEDGNKNKKMKKEVAPRVVGPEDEKYKLGYGVAGKGVKAPWYMTKPSKKDDEEEENSSRDKRKEKKEVGRSDGKRKSLEELREERLKRENKEKERVRALMVDRSVHKSNQSSRDRYYRR
ncbi:hypothetical protein V2J09_004042, partial [Rumex salicifolius]